jgi:sugar lactone lactonase YvrE
VGAGGSGGGPSAPAPFDLAKALAAKPETYVRLVGFPEGPAWRKDGSLILCQPMLTRIAPDKKRYRMLSFNCLGSVVLADDSILVTGAAGLYQVLPDGKVALLADTGAANDLSVDRDGNVYFTAGGAVHRVTPEGKHDRLTGGMGANGIEVDPKNEYLYVGQAGMNQITRFALPAKDRPLGPGAVHLRVPVPDGLAFDAHGHLWVAQHKEIAVGIWDVVGKKQLGKLEVPRSAAMIQNLAFGGAKNDELYVVGGNYDANALVVRFAVGVTGFKTNPGAKAYKPVRMLGETVNERAF